MQSGNRKISTILSVGIIRNWKETYQWIPIMGFFLAFATAFSTGANSLPVPFSTSVGSGTLTFLKASLLASIINVPGAALGSNSTVDTLFADFLEVTQPNKGFLMWSLVAVLITTIIWLAIATFLELPVSSQQSMQSALLGTVLVTKGTQFQHVGYEDKNKNFNGVSLIRTILEWAVAPPISGVITFCFFWFMKIFVLRQENVEKRIMIFLPIYYSISAGFLCFFLMDEVLPHIVTIERWETAVAVSFAILVAALLSLIVVIPLARRRFDSTETASINKRSESSKCHSTKTQDPSINKEMDDEEAKFEDALKEFMEMRVLDTVYEEDERSCTSPPTTIEPNEAPPVSASFVASPKSAPLKKLLESTPNWLVQTRGFHKIDKTTASKKNFSRFFRDLEVSTSSPGIEYSKCTLIRHALAEKFDEKIEDLLGFPQLLAACTLAIIQATNEIAAVVSPCQAILEIFRHRAKYSGDAENLGPIQVAWWLRAVGGFGASMGFILCGWQLTRCLGGKVTYLSNSRGLSSQLCSVAAMIVVSRMKLSISSTQSFVGSLIGVGIADDQRNVNWKLFLKFLCGWIGTILFCCGVASAIFAFTIYSPAYVVP